MLDDAGEHGGTRERPPLRPWEYCAFAAGFLAVKPSSKWPASREAVEARFCASGGMPMMVGDGPYADLQCWRLEGGDLDFALETRCGMPEQCSSEENAEDVRSQPGESMSGTIGAAWQQK